MQFDCMHVVCPIDDDSKMHFERVQRQGYSGGPNYLPPTISRKKAFPPVLLAINLVRSLDSVKVMMKLKSPQCKYEQMLAVLHRYRKETQFSCSIRDSKANLPRYTIIDKTDEQIEEISYEECTQRGPTGDSGEQMKLFKEKCINRAHRGSVLRLILLRTVVECSQMSSTGGCRWTKKKVK